MPLYALGSNSSYQLSLTHTNDVSSPTLTTLSLPKDEYPVKIASGANHTLLLTNKGTLYATGANRYGQCLKPQCEVVPGFQPVDGKWKDCSATWEGSIGVHEDGSIQSFGKIRDHKNIVVNKKSGTQHVVGGVQHFIIFGESEAIGYGDGRKGQLGSAGSEPVDIPAHDIVQVTAGKDFTCFLSSDDTLTVYTTSTKHNLSSVPACTNIKRITSSWSTLAILHNSGKITAWGRSDRGQLPPPNLPSISQLAAGSEHFIAISASNMVYTWGWNEHGNCGLESRKDVTSPHTLSLPQDQTPMYVAAGCATSWVWTVEC